MHLSETSLIKKYENDIGESIVDVGGDINHDNHWLPYLDNQIRDQLVADDIIDEKIDEKLDERGLTPEAVAAWNATVESLKGCIRFDESQFLTDEQQRQVRENIGLEKDDMYEAQWWDNENS